jgi:topoisomerase-4 subunit B
LYIGGCNNRGLQELWAGVMGELLANPKSRVDHALVQIEADGSLRLDVQGEIEGVLPAADYIPLTCRYDIWGIALAITSAMSERMELELAQENHCWRQHFVKGYAKAAAEPFPWPGRNYLRMRFVPDRELFASHFGVDFHSACGRIQEMAIFHPAITFSAVDASTGHRRDYRYAQGIRSYLDELEFHSMANEPKSQWGTPLRLYSLKLTEAGNEAEAVILDRQTGPRAVHAFVNETRCLEGTHIDGLERGIAAVLAQYPDFKWRCDTSKENDMLGGQTIVLSLRVPDLAYAGETKDRLASPAAESLVYRMITGQLPQQIRIDGPA